MNRVFVPLELPPAPLPGAAAQVTTLQGRTMGTSWAVKYIPPELYSAEEIGAGIRRILDEVVTQMSTWEADSDLSRFNRAEAGSWHALPQDFFHVLSCALQVAELSGGAYDPTIGPLVNLWGFGPAARRDAAPPQSDIDAQHARCGWRKLGLDAARRSACQAGDVYVDLSAIAKGFAVDRVAHYLRGIGCAACLVEIGGELAGFGLKPDGDPWWVEVERPPSSDAPRSLVALHGLSIATSGDYRRYFDSGGKRYAHTIDPRSARPVEHDLASVTVLHKECMLADAWSTALTVMGPEAGLACAEERGIAALFVARNGKEALSPAMAAMLD